MPSSRRKYRGPVDDRGKPFTSLPWELATERGATSTWPELLSIIVILTMLALGLGIFFFEPNFDEWGLLGRVASGALAVFVFGALFWARTLHRRYFSFQVRRDGQALRRSFCANCACTLLGRDPEPDGCIQCPECGAAWKADRVGKPPRGSAPG